MCINVFFLGQIFTTWQQQKTFGESNKGIFEILKIKFTIS
jgi:hypothetical protein